MTIERFAFLLVPLFVVTAAFAAGATNALQAAAANVKLPADDPFLVLVANASEQLQELCAIAPSHPYCGGNGGADIANNFDILQTEKIVQGAIAAVGLNIFYAQREAQRKSPSLIPILSPEERAAYFTKMSYLNQLSDTSDTLQHQLIALIVFRLTLDWIDIYGDVFHTGNLYVDETGQQLPLHAAETRTDQVRQGVENNLAALSVVGMLVLRTPQAKAVTGLLRGVGYLTLGLRMRLPISLIAQIAIPVGAVVAPYKFAPNALQKILNSKDILPAPAHLITFGFNADLSMIGDDIRAQWAEKEKAVYQEAVGGGVTWGLAILVNTLSDSTASKVATYLAEKGLTQSSAAAEVVLNPINLRYLRFVKGLRITPAGLVGGYVISKIATEALFQYRLENLKSALEQASRARDQAGTYDVIGRIIRLYMNSTSFIEQTLATEQSFSAYAALFSQPATFDQIARARANFISQMDPLKDPVATGASLLRLGLCRIITVLPPRQMIPSLTKEQHKNIDLDEVAAERGFSYQYLEALRSSLNDFMSNSNEIVEFFNTEIPNLKKSGLMDATQMLSNYNQKFTTLRSRVQHILDKYQNLDLNGFFVDNTKRVSPETTLRDVAGIEYFHSQDFQTHFREEYHCDDQYDGE